MGNKLCKKKLDGTDNPKSPTPFDRIINRLHLRQSTWNSDSQLNQKQVSRCQLSNDSNSPKENMSQTHLLSKSVDWTDVALEVPENDEAIQLRNPKLSLIFDNDSSTPIPPPRKHKNGIREKIEAVAKTGLQAFQFKKPVVESLCIKKTINPTCPVDDHDCAIHNRNHKQEQRTNELNAKKGLKNVENEIKQAKRRKNLSVVSLPNYNELKLSVANIDDIKNNPTQSENNSLASLQTESKKLKTTTSTGKLEICMTRCRSFGSLLPQQIFEKLRMRKIPIDIESDDSFGGLEDWDLKIIEHYNPTNTSLPRQSKPPRSNKDVLSDIENLIIKEDEIEAPKAPTRRSETLLKKINREASESAMERRSLDGNIERAVSSTPPPSPERMHENKIPFIAAYQLPLKENGQVEHSSLMKILEEFSIKDKQNSYKNDDIIKDLKITTPMNNRSIIIPRNAELQKRINSVEDFLHNEKLYINRDMQHPQVKNVELVTT